MEYTDLKLKGILTDTVSVSDYSMVTAKVARVIIAFTGNQTRQSITASLVKKFKGLAAPIESSFRLLDKNTAVGYVRANREVRMTDEKQIRASYKVLSKNILVSNEDETMWEVKKGAGSLYLARHGQEDLSDVIQSALTANTNAPKFEMVASVLPNQHDVVAYVTESGDVDYGFATKVGTKRVALVSHATSQPTIVNVNRVIASYEVEVDAKADKDVRKALVQAEARGNEKATMEDYYRQLYSYDTTYMNEVIEQIEQLSLV